uniref:GTP-binding protein Parf n=1 Tax=Schistosoma mansoni TaxID=6183 RepID=A0A3Q0KGS5_SCHMA
MSLAKKWWDKSETTTKRYSSADIQPIGEYLQEKFSHGVDYNMKIVIRGDRNVGKSTLLSRLKGEQFKEEYIPSNEIQLANIHWNHQNSQSVIKVEVWDVVDKGKPRSSVSKGVRFFNKLTKGQPSINIAGQAGNIEPCLDASFINVYKGAHGVILMMDMTKPSTFEYVCRELIQIPPKLPILIMSNFHDIQEQRKVTEEQVQIFLNDSIMQLNQYNVTTDEKVNELSRNIHVQKTSSSNPIRSIPVQYCESSMKTGLGLMYVYKFLNIPFLCLQRDVLQYQLKRNYDEMIHVLDELSPKTDNQTPEQRFSYIDSGQRRTTDKSSSSRTCSSSFSVIKENVANFPIKLTESNKTTVISFNPSNMNNQNNFDDNQNNFHMKRDEYNIIKTNEINEELNQNPMVIAFSEEIDPADNEIYYLNNNTTNTTTNNHSGSPTESYATVTPNSDNDNVLNITDDNLHFKNNENLSHEIMDELQLNLRLEQCYSHGKKVNLDYSNQFKRSALKTIDGTMANSGQLIKSESRQNKNTDEQEGILGTNLKNNKNLSISNENIIILPTDDDALEKFLEDS